MTKREWVMAVVCVGACALAAMSHRAEAQTAPALPTSCSRGELVVYDGGGRFTCESVNDVLRLSGCSSGDFVTAASGGGLRCVRPSNVSWDVRGLLPDCSSGSTLVSEGFGRWRCEAPRR